MSRKFVGTREIAFINAITRELHQRVVDEEILYYAIDLQSTRVHSLYNESIGKVWLPPVRITARVLFDNPNSKTGLWGAESQYASEVYFHSAELIERNVRPREGDFVEYGQQFYEITSVTKPQLIFGQINNKLLTKCALVPSREQQFQAGNQSDQNVDHSHPIENRASYSRQAPDPSVPSYLGQGQRELPMFTNANRPDPGTVVSGFEIFNTDAQQEQISDGTYWRDENRNIVSSPATGPAIPVPPAPTYVIEPGIDSDPGADEMLPTFSNVTRPAAHLVPGLEIWNSDAHAEQLSDGTHWRDKDGNLT